MIRKNTNKASKVKKIYVKDDKFNQKESVLASIEELVRVRPSSFEQVVGREKEKRIIQMMVASSKATNTPLEHILLYGPAGVGKTTIASVIANELNTNMIVTSGPALKKQADIVNIVTTMKPYDILFIDEIHRLNIGLEELLYPVMEDSKLDIAVGSGPGAKLVRIDLSPIVIIGATTKFGALSAPLRDRFGIVLKLGFYEINELKTIVSNASRKWGMLFEDEGLTEIAKRSRGVARVALSLTRRVIDFVIDESATSQKENSNTTNLDNKNEAIKVETVLRAVEFVGIDEYGLSFADYEYIKVLAENYDGGPVGVVNIGVALSEDISTIEDVIEPHLIRTGLLKKSLRGRVLTEKGIDFYGRRIRK